ncbi:MAG: type II toxin-antitoxin system HicB family antitoxin [Clostridiales Family XIII bacterium]|jgi:predicted RNase H-like HicB family nuclease|nr:type II toxin-antitoxin system HicB family antitoxin [Clostridiales Family XIII bacterium]
MRYAYPAIFKNEKKQVLVRVPDLPGTFTYGSDLPDAVYMAQDAASMWLWDAENGGEEIPAPSSLAEIGLGLTKKEYCSIIVADTDEYRRKHDTRAVKKTLSIPAWLNYEAERANAPFSQLLQESLKRYLQLT